MPPVSVHEGLDVFFCSSNFIKEGTYSSTLYLRSCSMLASDIGPPL